MYARSQKADAKLKAGGQKKTAKDGVPTANTVSAKPPGSTAVPKIVFICSPYRPTAKDVEDQTDELESNIDRARKACGIAATLGFMPLAPHLYFTQFLNDGDKQQREKGMAYGMQWLERADEVWVFGDKVSAGMKAEIKRAGELGKTVRKLPEPSRLVELMLKELAKNGDLGGSSADEGTHTITEQPMAAESEDLND